MSRLSSRSHTIFSIMVESRLKEDNGTMGTVRVSTLNLININGSENSPRIINRLSRAVLVATSNKTPHELPSSKLVCSILSSLLGNSKMAIIGCITASDMSVEETRSTLKFVAGAKFRRMPMRVANSSFIKMPQGRGGFGPGPTIAELALGTM